MLRVAATSSLLALALLLLVLDGTTTTAVGARRVAAHAPLDAVDVDVDDSVFPAFDERLRHDDDVDDDDGADVADGSMLYAAATDGDDDGDDDDARHGVFFEQQRQRQHAAADDADAADATDDDDDAASTFPLEEVEEDPFALDGDDDDEYVQWGGMKNADQKRHNGIDASALPGTAPTWWLSHCVRAGRASPDCQQYWPTFMLQAYSTADYMPPVQDAKSSGFPPAFDRRRR